MRPASHLILGAAVLTITLQSVAAVRVALMDFSTDDNSYWSMQRAADFTSLLQTRLQGESGVEWVERAQLARARQELELSAMAMLSGGHPIRLGRWVKADWMITGHFSTDDKNRRILSLEVIDLRHADLLASNIVVFQDVKTAQIQPDEKWINLAAENITRLLSESKMRQHDAARKVRIALLFANVHRFGGGIHMDETLKMLGQSLSDALHSAVATNDRVRLIRFPRTYRSLEESELVLEGLTEADPDAWQQVADLYVWGVYWGTNKPLAGSRVGRIIIRLHLWDGISVPKSIEEEIPCKRDGTISPEGFPERVNGLVSFVITNAHKRTAQGDFAEIRREIADSILRTYDQMTLRPGGSRESINSYDTERFKSAVHLLETACFFDPDNAKARLLYILTRWGPMIGPPSKVEFWSKWRRSVAWGKYVNRFGLAPSQVQLPFPHHLNEDICEPYLQSVEDLLEIFPQRYTAEEWPNGEKTRLQLIDFTLTQAELRGFPSDMPLDLAYKWRKEVEAEHWRRVTQVAEFIGAGHWQPKDIWSSWFLFSMLGRILNAEQPPSAQLALLEKIWPACIGCANKYDHEGLFKLDAVLSRFEQRLRHLCEQAGKPDRAAQLLAMIPRKQPPGDATPAARTPSPMPSLEPLCGPGPFPEWFGDPNAFLSMFQLYPPNLSLPKIIPPAQKFSFPTHFNVQAVLQIGFLNGRLLLLATDQRLALSTAPEADVSSEITPERSRLWVLEPGAGGPTLFEPELFTGNVRQFLIEGNRLWVCGDVIGCMDLKTRSFRRQTLSDGYDLQSAEGIILVDRDIFAAHKFALRRFDTQQNRWRGLDLPPYRFSWSSGYPCLFAGNKDWLCYVLGTAVFYKVKNGAWSVLATEEAAFPVSNVTHVTSAVLGDIGPIKCICADDSGFWFGGRGGLFFCDPNSGRLEAWQSPSFIQSPMGTFMSSLSPRNVSTELLQQIQRTLKKTLDERIRLQAARRATSPTTDPLNLKSRIPGSVTALAHDGDFLWLGTENRWGKHLLLLHKPTLQLVACCEMNLMGAISSLAVSDADVWIGTTDSDNLLLCIPKAQFLAIPQERWTPVAISDEERAILIRGMSKRDQAMYAFYAGDDQSVVSLLGDINPQKASIEEMFILAYSYASTNVNRIDLANVWFERIMAKYPHSPWEAVARTAMADSELRRLEEKVKALELRRYDRNGDGYLDKAERAAMETDRRRLPSQDELAQKRLLLELEWIVRRYDHNNDRALDLTELLTLRRSIDVYSKASREMPKFREHIRLLNPLLSDTLPAASVMLETYDTNRDGKLDAAELLVLARKLKRN